MSRKSAIRPAWSISIPDRLSMGASTRCAFAVGRARMRRKETSTNTRRLAFLAHQQAMEAHRRWARRDAVARMQGRKGAHVPEPDVQHYLDQYLAACEEQKRTFAE